MNVGSRICCLIILISISLCISHAAQIGNLGEKFIASLALAEQGDVDAQYQVGEMYYKGVGVKRDYAQALEWYRRSAEQGNANAQYQVGEMYYKGSGFAKDYPLALEWYQKAAEQGNASAQHQIGEMYYRGMGVEKDLLKAAEWVQKSAEQGYAIAQSNLGFLYASGIGVAKDPAKAIEWYQKSAEQGYVHAQYFLGSAYLKGEGVAKDLSKAAEWYRKSAEQGYAYGQYDLGLMYENGDGVEKDPIQAAQWIQKAAEQGYPAAQYNMGFRYKYGEGVEKDRATAVMWYRKAAEKGHADAQYNMALMYEYGEDLPRDDAQATEWYRKAAAQGHVAAKRNLELIGTKKKGMFKNDFSGASRAQENAMNLEHSANQSTPQDQGTGQSADYAQVLYLVCGVFALVFISFFASRIVRAKRSGEKDLPAQKTARRKRHHDTSSRYEQNTTHELEKIVLADTPSEVIEPTPKQAQEVAKQSAVDKQQFDASAPSRDEKTEERRHIQSLNLPRKTVLPQGKVTQTDVRENSGNDRAKAAERYLKSFRGNRGTMGAKLNEMYKNKVGAPNPPEPKALFQWYLSGAQKDIPHAQYMVGKMYADGEGVPRDQALSLSWMHKAAENGSEEAQKILEQKADE